MTRNIRLLLVALSVGLNVAFVAVWAAHRLPRGCRQDDGSSRRGCSTPSQLYESINASPTQRAEMDAHMTAFRTSCVPLCAEVNDYRLDLIDLLVPPEPDQAAIEATQTLILNGHSQMQARAIANLLQLKGCLTPEQQSALFAHVRERSRCAGHETMMINVATKPHCRR